MIIDGPKEHQHVDKQGRVFGVSHLITAIHDNKNTRKFHNITIMRDGLNNTNNCRKIGLKSVPLQ